MPFVKPVNSYENSVVGDSGSVGVYDITCDHWYGVELVLYCKLYEDMGAPPLLNGAVQLIVLIVFWYVVAEFITGALGAVDGVAVEFAGWYNEYGP